MSDELKQGNFIAVTSDEPQLANFHTAIYEDDYDGLLIGLCNQNGNHPHQAQLLLNGLAGKRQSAETITALTARVAELEAALRGLVSAVSNMRVPQSRADAAMQIMVTIGPALEAATAALAGHAAAEGEAKEPVAWPRGTRIRVEHDGFEGVVLDPYTTLEGKRGQVCQLAGARVVHVYGEKWLERIDGAIAAQEPKP